MTIVRIKEDCLELVKSIKHQDLSPIYSGQIGFSAAKVWYNTSNYLLGLALFIYWETEESA